ERQERYLGRKNDIGYCEELNFRMWFKYGLKAQKLQKQHALKGQKLLAQGIALGMMAISKTPCKGKSFINGLEF
uniref:hypothetical protein n=1 Tax=Prevotella sp. TaxID=59823 RepID=UPI003FEFE28E